MHASKKINTGLVYEMIESVRFYLSYDLLNAILLPSKIVYICIVVTDVIMTLIVPAKSVIKTCDHNIIYDMTLSTE